MMAVSCWSSYTLPAYLWTIFSSLAALLVSTGLYFSNWLQRETSENTYNSLSSFRLCLNETSQFSTSCQAYLTFGEIYSTEWKVVTLLMGIAACCAVFAATMSLFGLCIRKLFNKYMTALVAVTQTMGVVLCLVSVVVFPVGIDSDSVRHPELCGPTADSFKLGDCVIGWAYILVIIGTSLGAVAVGFSWTPARWREKHKRGAYTL